MTEGVGGVMLDRRVIPVPESISRQAADALRSMVGDDGVPLNALHHLPAAEDHEAWTALKEAMQANYAQTITEAAGKLRSQVVSIVAGGGTIHIATPEASVRRDCAIVDFHGGALVLGGGEACRVGTRQQADLHEICCYGVDYRTPPEHPFPAALDDCLAAYRYVLERHAPGNVVIAGRSAGGNLAAAMLLRARDEGLPMPAGLVLLSPQVDLTESGDSFAVNRTVDVVLPGSLMASNLLYANGADLADSQLSPLFGELAGFPPVLLQAGTRDLFLSNTVRMHRALRRAGVPADLHVFEAMPHGGFSGRTPEELELLREVIGFVAARLASPVDAESAPRGRLDDLDQKEMPMTLSDLLVPTYVQMLGALSQWLAKAEAQRPDGTADALLAARLAPGMFPLATQVRFACRQAQEGVFRLLKQDFPPSLQTLLDEGRNAGEQPGTLADAQARILESIAVVEAAAAERITIEPATPIAHELPNGMTLDLTAEQYTRDWALSQFYFHLVTAYSIMRAQGIELGKADYVSHMFGYFRQPATP